MVLADSPLRYADPLRYVEDRPFWNIFLEQLKNYDFEVSKGSSNPIKAITRSSLMMLQAEFKRYLG